MACSGWFGLNCRQIHWYSSNIPKWVTKTLLRHKRFWNSNRVLVICHIFVVV